MKLSTLLKKSRLGRVSASRKIIQFVFLEAFAAPKFLALETPFI
jgi:hypothetical protein